MNNFFDEKPERDYGKTIFDSIFGLVKSILGCIAFILFIFTIWLFFDEFWAMGWLIFGVIYFIVMKFIRRGS